MAVYCRGTTVSGVGCGNLGKTKYDGYCHTHGHHDKMCTAPVKNRTCKSVVWKERPDDGLCARHYKLKYDEGKDDGLVCGHQTTKGGPCRNVVKRQGASCSHHGIVDRMKRYQSKIDDTEEKLLMALSYLNEMFGRKYEETHIDDFDRITREAERRSKAAVAQNVSDDDDDLDSEAEEDDQYDDQYDGGYDDEAEQDEDDEDNDQDDDGSGDDNADQYDEDSDGDNADQDDEDSDGDEY